MQFPDFLFFSFFYYPSACPDYRLFRGLCIMPAAAAAAAAPDSLSLLMYWLLLVRRCLVQLQLLLRIISYLTISTVRTTTPDVL